MPCVPVAFSREMLPEVKKIVRLPTLFILGAALVLAPAGFSAEVKEKKGLLERLMNPDRSSKSDYEGKVFNGSGSFSGRAVKTKEFQGTKNFAAGDYATKEFSGSRKGWLGNLFFPEKKLPENLQGPSRDQGKTFGSKDFGVKNYDASGKKSSFASRDEFATRDVNLKGKSQGAIDSDQKLQEAIKKGLSIDEVRNLLNKAP